MTSRHTDRCKTIFLKRKGVVMVRDCAGYGESKLVAETVFPNPESLGLKVF
jgi:hypothetical protein